MPSVGEDLKQLGVTRTWPAGMETVKTTLGEKRFPYFLFTVSVSLLTLPLFSFLPFVLMFFFYFPSIFFPLLFGLSNI